MNNKFDSPRERNRPMGSWLLSAPLSRGKLSKSMAQSVTQRSALKKFGVGLAGMSEYGGIKPSFNEPGSEAA